MYTFSIHKFSSRHVYFHLYRFTKSIHNATNFCDITAFLQRYLTGCVNLLADSNGDKAHLKPQVGHASIKSYKTCLNQIDY
jgi:hypothetical protein